MEMAHQSKLGLKRKMRSKDDTMILDCIAKSDINMGGSNIYTGEFKGVNDKRVTVVGGSTDAEFRPT